MVKVLLACNAGMSTSLLVTRMEKAAKEKGIEAQITAVGYTEIEKMLDSDDWQIVMLGPQVRHYYGALQKKYGERIPIVVIEMRDYGLMNGEAVLNAAIKAIG